MDEWLNSELGGAARVPPYITIYIEDGEEVRVPAESTAGSPPSVAVPKRAVVTLPQPQDDAALISISPRPGDSSTRPACLHFSARDLDELCEGK